jgi:hypothetical protein
MAVYPNNLFVAARKVEDAGHHDAARTIREFAQSREDIIYAAVDLLKTHGLSSTALLLENDWIQYRDAPGM